ncbi:MAG: outer membrane beta-barrel protein [Bacteroidetes bacterium]|nr:outer membrane beta-barrel protein [Bacteroidota bacterium]
MHENKFEKEVQGKLEELQFTPSDAVWANVDQKINKEKKRRRFFFWLFFFSGLMLLGGVYWYRTQQSNPGNLVISPKQKENKTAPLQEQTNNSENSSPEKTVPNKADENNNLSVGADAATRTNGNNKIEEPIASTNNKQGKDLLINKAIHLKTSKNQNLEKINFGKTGSDLFDKTKSKRGKPSQSDKSGSADLVLNKGLNRNKDQSDLGEKDNTTPSDKTVVVRKPKLKDGQTDMPKNKPQGNPFDSLSSKKSDGSKIVRSTIAQTDSIKNKNLASTKRPQKKPSKWKIGYTSDAGVSSINQTFFRSTYVATPPYTMATAFSLAAPIPGNNTAYSKIYPNFSFGIGALANQPLSNHISLSVGLGYHYYSTCIFTGNGVDSTVVVYAASARTTAVNGYYNNGDNQKYTNQYHSIELPISLNFQLNKNNKHPLIWEAGATFSYLIYSNAMIFDPVTNVYYKNSQLLNRSQLYAGSAIMYGIPIGKGSLQVGPQLQYGITRVLNSDASNPEHMLFGGVKIIFFPQKK